MNGLKQNAQGDRLVRRLWEKWVGRFAFRRLNGRYDNPFVQKRLARPAAWSFERHDTHSSRMPSQRVLFD